MTREEIVAEKVRIAMAFYANTEMQIELIDEMKSTDLYDYRIKMFGNQMLKLCEKQIDGLYKELKHPEAESFFQKSTVLSKVLIDAIKVDDIDILIQFLIEYKKGNVKVVPD